MVENKSNPNVQQGVRATQQISKDRLIGDLKKIGISRGDHIGVALSFKSMGYVDGGPNTLIDALLGIVGPDGTIIMPTYTYGFHVSKVASGKVDYIFDYRTTPAWTGLVPETLRRRKGSIRSRHPITSITTIGRLARYFTEDHNEHARPYLPYSRLAKVNGKILCIGLGDSIVAIRHEAQYLAGLMNVFPPTVAVKYRGEDEKISIYVTNYIGGCTVRLPEFIPILKRMGMIKDEKIGMASSILVSAKDFLEITSQMLRKNPTLNLCDDITCLWCRELERRMDLFKRIENPKFFQKHTLLIKIIALINWFRMKNYIASEITFIGVGIIKRIMTAVRERRNPINELKSLYRARSYNMITA